VCVIFLTLLDGYQPQSINLDDPGNLLIARLPAVISLKFQKRKCSFKQMIDRAGRLQTTGADKSIRRRFRRGHFTTPVAENVVFLRAQKII